MSLPTTPTGADFDLRGRSKRTVTCSVPVECERTRHGQRIVVLFRAPVGRARYLKAFNSYSTVFRCGAWVDEPQPPGQIQNTIFPLNCICRGLSAVPLTEPKLGLNTSLFGMPKTG